MQRRFYKVKETGIPASNVISEPYFFKSCKRELKAKRTTKKKTWPTQLQNGITQYKEHKRWDLSRFFLLRSTPRQNDSKLIWKPLAFTSVKNKYQKTTWEIQIFLDLSDGYCYLIMVYTYFSIGYGINFSVSLMSHCMTVNHSKRLPQMSSFKRMTVPDSSPSTSIAAWGS